MSEETLGDGTTYDSKPSLFASMSASYTTR
jgi:hypothetical protein